VRSAPDAIQRGDAAYQARHAFWQFYAMMPGVGGLEVCERLRSDLKTAFVPVLMLTGNHDEATRTKGFIAGTDDFMPKPFAVPELVAPVRRLLRRTYGI
jgi:DNA-binding response OmpR family regulator